MKPPMKSLSVFTLTDKGLEILVEKDPNLKWSNNVKRKILLDLPCYQILI